MLPKRLTAKYLAQRGACRVGVSDFKRVFPHGARLSRKTLLEAAERGVMAGDLLYFHRVIMGRRQRTSFYRACKEAKRRNMIAAGYELASLNCSAKLVCSRHRAKTAEAARMSFALCNRICRAHAELGRELAIMYAECIADDLGLL